MKRIGIAALSGLATLGAYAQVPSPVVAASAFDPVIVTAARSFEPSTTLRDAIVVTRSEIDAAGPVSLGELLQRRAGIELRANGGPGQPQTIFIRGAGSAQTLVLVDGLRVGDATVGVTSIENIPLEMIERIEIVKGPLSSLYGAEAMGGVIQIFTRGKSVPHFFATAGYGNDNDRRLSVGLSTADKDTVASLSMGARAVDARSATNPRAGPFVYNPDRDPYANAFAALRVAQTLWQGETLEIAAFGSRARTHYDGGADTNDRNDQSIAGAKLSSSTHFAPWWASRIAIGSGLDRTVFHGGFNGFFETRQDQASWVNEFRTPLGNTVVGAETVRQHVDSDADDPFSVTSRNTNSYFLGLNEAYAGQRLEASVRRDEDDQFGRRNTGSVSYGFDLASTMQVAASYGRGFRAPSFFDLYSPFGNAALAPERSRSSELAFKSLAASSVQWKLAAFDNRYEDLIVFVQAANQSQNVARARVRGIEASIDASWAGTRLRASLTAQRPRDETTGLRLRSRAERYGTLDASRDFGAWTAGVTVVASGARFDSSDESPGSRLGGYAVVDARLRYKIDARWSAQLTAANLGDRRYENTVGYDAPRRSIFLGVSFESY